MNEITAKPDDRDGRAPPLRLALGHQSRVGKDTFAEYIVNKFAENHIHVLSFANPVYSIHNHIQHVIGVNVTKDPKLLQSIGTLMRGHFSENIFVDMLANRVQEIIQKDPRAGIIVTDMRFMNEMECLRSMSFSTIKITRDCRVIDRDIGHPSETELACAEFDFVINNNNTIQDFYRSIDEMIDLR